MYKRTIVVGDIHGCLDELKELLEAVKFSVTYDRLICCGDIFDRGPYSLEALRYLKVLSAEVVLGNHEDKYLRFHRHEVKAQKNPKYKNPMTRFPERKMELYAKMKQEDFDYLESLPRYIRMDEDHLIVHAGVQPGVPIGTQNPNNFTYMRFIKPDGQVHVGAPEESLAFWANSWTGPGNVIYGHFVHNLHSPVWTKAANGTWCLGIDTGCCFGGKLTAIVFEEDGRHWFRQVDARKAYMVWREDNVGISDY